MWCWRDPQSSAIQVRAVDVATAKEVPLKEGAFLLRVSTTTNRSAVRCLIRHIASGREAYVQGGSRLRAFVKTCLLANSMTPTSDDNGPPT
ncbi:MAG: hypothetical protein J2P37_09460 [Ktedonobacteraceae bacterium]|nr:hypothetical protein [Ktedonobacteraceae bacterium]